MSGQAALDLLLDPVARQLARVTLPEGLTVQRTLARLAEETGKPEAEFQAALADPAALGLPPYANGLLEGFLFPATYDVEPDDAPADILRQMVGPLGAGARRAADPGRAAAHRRHQGQPGAGRGGLRRGHGQGRPGPGEPAVRRDGAAAGHHGELRQQQGRDHHHRRRTAPTPRRTTPTCTPACRRGRSATRARTPCAPCWRPTPGEWRFFVVVDPDTGETRFGATAAEHQQNVLLFQQWLRENPEG